MAREEAYLADPKRHEFLSAVLPRAGVGDARVLAAMGAVRREVFVPAELVPAAYEDRPLPIGYEQTISQPSLVGLMTQALDVEKSHRVLEVGTGSGYQTALLAELGAFVYTVERDERLLEKAADRLQKLGYAQVHFRAGDGAEGWAEKAPFDRIMVTAAAPRLPGALLEQLKPGGRLVIPIGEARQELFLYVKGPVDTEVRSLGAVSFVPLVSPVLPAARAG